MRPIGTEDKFICYVDTITHNYAKLTHFAADESILYPKRSLTEAVATRGFDPKDLWSVTLRTKGGRYISSLGSSCFKNTKITEFTR